MKNQQNAAEPSVESENLTPGPGDSSTMSSPATLMRSRRFAPIFWVQFLGAFNDNLFKNALVVMVTYQIASSGLDNKVLVNLAALLFIAPFFFVSPLAGQLADKLEKGKLVRAVKLAEIAIMVIAAAGFIFDSLIVLFAMLFLAGVQSTVFGPIKYGILPQHLRTHELVGGNALIELGTFLSILLGTIAGGLLIGTEAWSRELVGIAIIVVAVLGYLASTRVPLAPPPSPEITIEWNLLRETGRLLGYATGNRAVFLSMLGISWFWFFGVLVLTQIPPYTREVLYGDNTVATLLLTCFSVGVGIGSLLCERLSGRIVELGLVPIAAAGMTVCGIALAFLHPNEQPAELYDAIGFLSNASNWPLLLDLIALSAFAGLYIVPLYAYVQWKSPESHRSRIIAGLNIMTAIFMLAAIGLALAVLGAGASIPTLFLIVALLNAAITSYIFFQVPDFCLRLVMWLLVHSIYRVEKADLRHIPDEGPAVLVANHVSYVDGLILSAVSPRPIRFVVYHKIYDIAWLKPLFKAVRAIPIAPSREDPERLEAAYEEIANSLEIGALVAIFPEGGLTNDGDMMDFKPGIERIVKRSPVPVVPMALKGLWGSYFSRANQRGAMSGWPSKWSKRIAIASAPAVAPNQVRATELEQTVRELRGDWA